MPENKHRSILIYSPQMNHVGGIEVHLVEIACLLKSVPGVSVVLLTSSNSLSSRLVQSLKDAGVEYRYLDLPLGSASRWRKALWLWSQVWNLRRRRLDVVYTNGQGSLTPIIWKAAHPGTRVVHHHHTSADAQERSKWGRYVRVLAKAPELIACSKATAANILEATGQREIQVFSCLYPVSGDTSMPSPGECHGRSLRFSFVGRLSPSKGIEMMMRLAEDPVLSDIEWHIHGSGDDYPPEYFEGCERVFYHGAFSGAQELRKVHAASDALALFSTHSEGLPLMLLEGCRSGIPWIASDRGGTRELLLRSPDCSLLPRDFTYQQARDGVRTLADSIREGRTSRIELARRFESEYSADVWRRKWLDFFGVLRAE